MNKSCLVLIAHGSRNPKWSQPFEQLLAELRRKVGADRVRLSYIQMEGPALADVVRELAAKGIKMIKVLPLFMSSGNHYEEDIPALISKLSRKYPDVYLEILPPIGRHPRFKSMMLSLAEDCLREVEFTGMKSRRGKK